MIKNYRTSGFFILVWVVFIAGATFLNSNSVSFSQLSPAEVFAMKLLQLVSALLIFVFPVMVFCFLFPQNKFRFLNLTNAPDLKHILFVTLTFLVALPGINLIADWNMNIEFPSFMAGAEDWIRKMEKQAQELTNIFLDMKSPLDLIINLVIIALVAAVGEELFFRGMIQKYLTKALNMHHLAVWITAFLFSALHGQFLGFIPRLLLGAMLGYFFYYSGSLWIPIIGHFINNGIQVIAAYFMLKRYSLEEINNMQSTQTEIYLGIVSIVLTFGFVLYFAYFTNKQKEKPLQTKSII